ncbi:MAG: DUF4010 domain-containing protein [Bacteroidales bacterium]|nr:DUF4010 domain-containing protein [Bacteroidales bacterium]
MHYLETISPDFINFILVTLMSLLIGLEQRHRHMEDLPETLYGTDRTYTFTGILGFVLYVISPDNLFPFVAGGFAIVVFLGIFYWKRIITQNRYGITSMIVLLITYCLGPLLYIKPLWLTILLVTTILIFIELKSQFKTLTGLFDNNEFITLAKFMIIAGIILPMLPDKIISAEIPISPYKIWLAVVVISGISYLSYLIQKFILPSKGLVITGILGGMYSSTATTLVLARKSKNTEAPGLISSSIILATGMMFIRVLILAFIFNAKLGEVLMVPILSLMALTMVVAWIVNKTGEKTEEKVVHKANDRNPLEFKTALLFAALFVIFALVTRFVLDRFGVKGLDLLSLIVGVTDIDPFLLSMFTGKYDILLTAMAHATLIAVTSNNLIKLGYALFFGSKNLWKPLITGFAIIIAASVLFIIF